PDLGLKGEGADRRLDVRLARFGRPGAMREVPAVRRRSVEGNRVEYIRGSGLTEWYVNGPLGVEQGIEIVERPASDSQGPLVVEIAVGGGFEPDLVGDDTIALETKEGEAHLTYRNLFVRDADGESVSARMAVHEGRIRLVVEDNDARYPLTIDPTFGSQQVITTDADYASSVHAADLDGDGDPDVLSASVVDDKVAWYRNTGGGFGPQQVISTEGDGPRSVHTADIDGDGAPDVLSDLGGDNEIGWYRNRGGSFGAQQVITTNVDGPRSVSAMDVDGDGDPDVL
ncbi:MAG: FG-GAP repeat domain-containing protein, partial [Bradymonadaceae bacterium]